MTDGRENARPAGKWFRKRAFWVPTWRVWLCLIAAVAGLLLALGNRVYSFLALVDPVENADILVMEGWIPDYAVEETLAMFRDGGYEWLCTTGIEIEVGKYFTDAVSYAGLGGATLLDLGMDADRLIIAHGPEVYRDRTWHSAVALKTELEKRGMLERVQALNLVSFGTHARRSRNVFRAVFGPEIEVGVVSIPTRGYDPDKWYGYSGGVKAVITELISLAYEWFHAYLPTAGQASTAEAS
jgi:hypothetical protein